VPTRCMVSCRSHHKSSGGAWRTRRPRRGSDLQPPLAHGGINHHLDPRRVGDGRRKDPGRRPHCVPLPWVAVCEMDKGQRGRGVWVGRDQFGSDGRVVVWWVVGRWAVSRGRPSEPKKVSHKQPPSPRDTPVSCPILDVHEQGREERTEERLEPSS
jgi:hypothetical protein